MVTVEEIKELIKESHMDLNVDISEDHVPLSNFGIDSLMKMGILLAVEETFNINIPDEDVDRLKTVNDLVDYVNRIKK